MSRVLSLLLWLSLTCNVIAQCPSLPTSIRVGTNCPTKINSKGEVVPDCNISCTIVNVISLESYTQNGLDNEWIPSWNIESLKAGAVAYRTYGAYFIKNPINANYDIRSDACNQAWASGSTTTCINAANLTVGEVIVNNSNQIVKSEYAAETNDNNNLNSSCGDCYSGEGVCISDNVCCGKTFDGHGRGMCQWGSSRWATSGKIYTWILDHYYNPSNYFRCNSTPCTPPSNDNCSNATVLTPSTSCNYQTFSTNCATQSVAATSPCNGFTAGKADDDVWFKFTANAGATYTVNLLNGTNFDGVLDLRSACDGTSIACDDQPGSTGVKSSVTYTPSSTQTLYARVYHYGADSGGGNFQICVTQSGGGCTTPGAPTNVTASAISQNSANLSWASGNPTGSASVTYEWAVGTSSSVTYESGYTDRGTTGTLPVVTNVLECNTQYYLRVRARTNCNNSVSGYGTSSSFKTNACSSTGVMCNNDEACSPRSLTINTNGSCSTINCSTIGATTGAADIPFYGASNCSTLYQTGRYDDDVWFSITPSSTNPITIRVTPTSNLSNFDPVIGLYQGSCSNPNQITCAGANSNGIAETLQFYPSLGVTYRIRVFGYGIGGYSSGDFQICAFSSSGSTGDICSTPTNPTESSDQTSATLRWSHVSGAYDYNVRYRVVGTSSWTSAGWKVNNELEISNLQCNTQYEWQVRAACDYEDSDFTSVRRFWTSVCTNTCTAAGNISIGSSQTGATVLWSSPVGTSSTYLRWKLRSESAYNQAVVSNVSSYNIANLDCNQQYELHIISNCNSGGTVSSATQYFNTLSCTNTNPCNDITTISSCGSNYTQTFVGSSSGAWDENDCYDAYGNEKIYRFVAPTTGNYSIQVTSTNNAYVDYLWKSGSCSSGGWNCIDDINKPGEYGSMSWTAGNTYYILLDNEYFQSENGTHSFYINCSCVSPTQPKNISGNNIICSGTSQTYTIPAVADATSYQWSYSGGGNPSGTGRSITFSPTSSGTLSVAAVNNCGTSTVKTLAITVNPLPARPGTITASANNICNGTSVNYSVPAVSGATSYTWSYSGGGNSSGKGNSISFKPMSSGTLSVVANNDCGSGVERTLAVTVKTVPDKPVIYANGNTTLCENESVVLTTSLTGVNYQWKMNGSNISGANKRSYSTTSAGTYTLVASNDCGNSAVSNSIIVSTIKSPARPGVITASSNNICSGETISFSVPEVKDAETYTWTYSGTGTPTGKSNKISFKPTSDGILTVIAENSCGVSTSRTLNVKVSAKPSRPEAISGSTDVCNGTTVTYQVAPVSGAEKYTWSYDGGGKPSGTGRSITLKPTSDGTLTVVAENFCGVSTSRTLKITVNTLPERPTAISGQTNLCSGEEVKYQIPVISGADTYEWSYSGKGTLSGNGRSITLKPTTSGTLTVSGKNKCGLGSPSTLQIKVTPIPLRPSVIQGGSTVCKGTNQTYFVDADADVKSYTWSYTGDETVTGTGRTISFKPLSNGTLSVVAYNDCGESLARTLKIVVKDGVPTSQPGPIKGETSYCSGTTQKYTIDRVGGAKGYLWTYSGEGQPIGDGTTVTLTPITSGSLRVVALSDCGSGVARTLSLSIRAIPNQPIITKTNDVLISNYNTGNQWYLDGMPIHGANEKTFMVNEKGVYSVEYTSPYGCKSISEIMEVLSVSVDEKEVGIAAFTIYPNPNDGYFTIEIVASKVKTAKMDIVNVLGQVISSEELKSLYGKQTFKKDLSKYGKGLYFVNLYFEEGVVTRRVVIE